MKSINKKIIAVLLIAGMLLSTVFIPAAADSIGIQSKFNDIRTVYYDGTYFTQSFGPSGGSQNNDCALSNIPARGILPAGSVVVENDDLGEAWSCVAFADYVFYYCFGCSAFNEKNTVYYYDFSNLVIGDYVRFNYGTHTVIYLWEDDDYYYVFDCNGKGDHNCDVMYNRKFSKEYFYIYKAWHAWNYDEVANSTSGSLYSLPEGSYKLKNARSSYYIGSSLTPTATKPTSYNLTVKRSTGGFTIAASDKPGTYLAVDLSKKLTTSTTISNNSLWICEKTAAGAYLRNLAFNDLVLELNNGALRLSTFTGQSTQMWRVDHEDHDYLISVLESATCTHTGIEQYNCGCGEETIVETAKLAHSYKTIKTYEATASVCGFTLKQCTVCGSYTRDNLVKKTSTISYVSTSYVKDNGETIMVKPGIGEEEFKNLFPDYSVLNMSAMLATGAYIWSTLCSEGRTVVVCGDCNSDGKSDVNDARGILRIAIGLDTANDAQKKASDWDGNDKIEVADARYQLRYSIGLEKIEKYFS